MTATAIEIRTATTHDKPAIDSFANIVVHDTYGRLVDADYANDLLQQWWGPALHPSVDNGFVHIAVADGNVIGLAHIGEWNNEPALWKLYVAPGRRGDGLGRRLIEAVIAALPANTPRLVTEHIAANVDAERFYVREGFDQMKIDDDTGDPRTWTVWRAKALPTPDDESWASSIGIGCHATAPTIRRAASIGTTRNVGSSCDVRGIRMTSGPATSLRNEPAFVRWATAEGISMLGSSVTTVVLPVIVYQATGSAALTGLLFALRVVPYLLFGLVAGPLADRGNRRRLIIGGNVTEGLLVATIPIAHLLGVLSIAQIYVVALLSATAFVFSDAAVFGAVPALVGPERLPAAHGLLSSMGSATEIAGPVIAGLLVASIGTTTAIWIDAASFLIAAAIQSRIRSSFRTSEPEDVGTTRLVDHARAALRFIRSERTVATLLGAGFGNSLAFGTVLGLLVPYAVEQLGYPTTTVGSECCTDRSASAA